MEEKFAENMEFSPKYENICWKFWRNFEEIVGKFMKSSKEILMIVWKKFWKVREILKNIWENFGNMFREILKKILIKIFENIIYRNFLKIKENFEKFLGSKYWENKRNKICKIRTSRNSGTLLSFGNIIYWYKLTLH